MSCVATAKTYRVFMESLYEDRTFLLLFAKQSLQGQRAQQLSECLDVPIEDPRADLFRSSRLFWLRWMGASEEWKVLLMTTCIGVVLGLSWAVWS